MQEVGRRGGERRGGESERGRDIISNQHTSVESSLTFYSPSFSCLSNDTLAVGCEYKLRRIQYFKHCLPLYQ